MMNNDRTQEPKVDLGFYALVPRLVRTQYKNLTAIQKWLYVCLKDLCGDKGVCYRTLRVLSEETGISTGLLSESIPLLHEAGLIHAEKKKRTTGGKEVWHITIVDIWQANAKAHSSKHSQDEQERSPREQTFENVHHVNEEARECSPRERECSQIHDRRNTNRSNNITEEITREDTAIADSPPSQDSLLEVPLTEPLMNGSWNHEKAVQYAEWSNGKRYSAKMREAQLKAAQALHKGDSSLTLEQFKQAYDERNDVWWKEHKGRLDVTDMKAKEQSSGVVRIYAMLERTQQHKAKPSLQVVAPNKEQERASVLVPKRQSLINFMNLFINAGSVPESYLKKFNDAQAEGIDLPLDKLEHVRSLPIQAVRSAL